MATGPAPPRPAAAGRQPSFRGPQEMITVAVKSPTTSTIEKFTIHKNFICHYAPYFSILYPSITPDGEPNIPELESEPSIFTGLVNWIYTQEIKDTETETSVVGIEFLVGLWILAEQTFIPKLQNQVMRLLQTGKTGYCKDDGQLLKYAYRNSSKKSPLRRVLVDIFIQDLGSFKEGEAVDYSVVPLEMFVDIMEVMRKQNLVRKFVKSKEGDLLVKEDVEAVCAERRLEYT